MENEGAYGGGHRYRQRIVWFLDARVLPVAMHAPNTRSARPLFKGEMQRWMAEEWCRWNERTVRHNHVSTLRLSRFVSRHGKRVLH